MNRKVFFGFLLKDFFFLVDLTSFVWRIEILRKIQEINYAKLYYAALLETLTKLRQTRNRLLQTKVTPKDTTIRFTLHSHHVYSFEYLKKKNCVFDFRKFFSNKM